MAGRVGNKGYSYFSENAYNNLQKAVDIMTKLEQVTKGNVKSTAEQVELINRYKSQLKEIGVSEKETLQSLERELVLETEIMQARKKEADEARKKEASQKRDERSRERIAKFERDYQREISNAKSKEIQQQRELDKLLDEARNKIKKKTLSEKEYNAELNKVVKAYKEQEKINNSNKAKEEIAGTFFGTTSQDIQDIKDGKYWWKLGVKTFAKAVDVFKKAVGESIQANYSNTENTLNSITASNRMSWSSGSFSFGGNTYTGFSKLNNAINDRLLSEGLFNNISNIDVSKAVSELTSTGGFGLEDALAKGYQDTVIKYIVPYLDTTSEAFNNLELLMPRYL